jgi:hypothetical protein
VEGRTPVLCVKNNGKSMEALNFAEFGFADGRSQNPNKAWELLRVLAEERGHTKREGSWRRLGKGRKTNSRDKKSTARVLRITR